MPLRGITVRQAIGLALEDLSGSREEWLVPGPQRKAMEGHVVSFVIAYATKRGLILETKDVTAELERIISELKRGLSVEPIGTETE
jgi:hypothetical protein